MLNCSDTEVMPPARMQTQQALRMNTLFPQGYKAGHNWTKTGTLTGMSVIFVCVCMSVCYGREVLEYKSLSTCSTHPT